jgi:hypothetical protein
MYTEVASKVDNSPALANRTDMLSKNTLHILVVNFARNHTFVYCFKIASNLHDKDGHPARRSCRY